MQTIAINENELTGSTLVIPFTALVHFGPKHHAIVLGEDQADGDLWIAELSRKHGYRFVSLKRWIRDNRGFSQFAKLKPNVGIRSNVEVAESAVNEVLTAQETGLQYNILFNNCETFANRHRSGRTTLSPQVKKTLKVLGVAVLAGASLLSRKLANRVR